MTSNHNFKIALGERLAALREKRELDQDEVGILGFGYSSDERGRKRAQSRISKFECGRKEPSSHELVILCKILKSDPTTILKGLPEA